MEFFNFRLYRFLLKFIMKLNIGGLTKKDGWKNFNAQKKPDVDIVGNIEDLSCDRNSSGDVYFADGGLTVVRSEFLENVKRNLLPFRWMGNRIHLIEQIPGGSDIDDYWQVAAMEAWLTKHGFTKSLTPYK